MIISFFSIQLTIKISICSSNDLVPNRCRAITYTNDDPLLWHVHASSGICELSETVEDFDMIIIFKSHLDLTESELNFTLSWYSREKGCLK